MSESLEIECSTCGHKGTVPDSFLGQKVQCPGCQTMLVPLTPDKMEAYAAKVLFASKPGPEEVIPAQAEGPEILFECPFCGDSYLVSVELAGKPIRCRSCREMCRVDEPEDEPVKRRRRRRKIKYSLRFVLICIAIAFLMGLLMGYLMNNGAR